MKYDDVAYKDCLKKLDSFLKFGIRPGLERIKIILREFKNPQNRFKSIHVAGTNGKGSICEIINSILINSKSFSNVFLKVGIFTSPHLICPRERIKINNFKISKIDFVKYFYNILDVINKKNVLITEFEFITIMAFLFFKDQNVDIAIIETGLGGEFDSTNVIPKPLVCIIGEISFDHTEILGSTIENISYQKAGIIKKNTCLILSPNQHIKTVKIFKRKCKELNSKFIYCDNIVKIKENTCILNENYEIFTYKNKNYKVSLFGDHQSRNLSAAFEALKILKNYFDINNNSIEIGLKNISIKARFQKISSSPLIILDGAHNPGGVKVLILAINKYLKNYKKIAIIGVLKNKDFKNMLLQIFGIFEEIILTKPRNIKSADPNELFVLAKNASKNVIIINDPRDAIKYCIKKNNTTVIFGSLYLAKDTKFLS